LSGISDKDLEAVMINSALAAEGRCFTYGDYDEGEDTVSTDLFPGLAISPASIFAD
jgi:hypothetical protein